MVSYDQVRSWVPQADALPYKGKHDLPLAANMHFFYVPLAHYCLPITSNSLLANRAFTTNVLPVHVEFIYVALIFLIFPA